MGSGGGGELLVPWPEAMGLIIQLPSLRDREGEEVTRPVGRVIKRPPSFSLSHIPIAFLGWVFWRSHPRRGAYLKSKSKKAKSQLRSESGQSKPLTRKFSTKH